MYVVTTGQKIVYLGDSEGFAMNLYRDMCSIEVADCPLEKSNFAKINDLHDLQKMIFPKKSTEEVKIKSILDSLLDKLDYLIDEKLPTKKDLYENFEKVIAEVKPLGMKGMKAVGEGFIAIGDLLKENSKEKNK